MYGKQTETAIASVSRLAEVYDAGKTRLSSADIARDRGLQPPFVAKLLTILSQAGIVDGTPGPGGGYALAKHPSQIKLRDVYCLFERDDTSPLCPFGGGICGVGDPCAIHNKLIGLQAALADLLNGTTLEEFRRRYQDEGIRPVRAEAEPPAERQSYRAPKSGPSR
jgi:Rrf2 family protein